MLKQMKNKSLTFVAAALLTVGGAGVAFAHGRGGEPGEGRPDDAEAKKEHEARRAEMLAKYDANKDGKLDDTERAKAHADMVAQRFAELDTNKDGVLSKDEFAAQKPMGPHRHQR
jgi:hypothetical protein